MKNYLYFTIYNQIYMKKYINFERHIGVKIMTYPRRFTDIKLAISGVVLHKTEKKSSLYVSTK